jgi:hypothetical protein
MASRVHDKRRLVAQSPVIIVERNRLAHQNEPRWFLRRLAGGFTASGCPRPTNDRFGPYWIVCVGGDFLSWETWVSGPRCATAEAPACGAPWRPGYIQMKASKTLLAIQIRATGALATPCTRRR